MAQNDILTRLARASAIAASEPEATLLREAAAEIERVTRERDEIFEKACHYRSLCNGPPIDAKSIENRNAVRRAAGLDAERPTGDRLMSECRRCSECLGNSHHWLDNPDGGNDPAESEHDPERTHICKHCDAVGDECDECGGSGRGECVGRDYENCCVCDGEGVVVVESTFKAAGLDAE